TATDIAGNTGTTSFLVTVNLADDLGTMAGVGQVNASSRVTFVFFARQGATGAERGSVEVLASRPRGLPNTFVTQSLDQVVFLGTSVRFSGGGNWNGQSGYTFVAEATDNGEPGAGHDTFSMTVRSPQGDVVLQAAGLLNAGNVQKVK